MDLRTKLILESLLKDLNFYYYINTKFNFTKKKWCSSTILRRTTFPFFYFGKISTHPPTHTLTYVLTVNAIIIDWGLIIYVEGKHLFINWATNGLKINWIIDFFFFYLGHLPNFDLRRNLSNLYRRTKSMILSGLKCKPGHGPKS